MVDGRSTPEDNLRMQRTGTTLVLLALAIALAVVCGAGLLGYGLMRLARRL